MHLCTISVDRFLSLRYPMKFGRHKTRKRVLLKLVFVWCLSLATSMPLSLLYAADSRATIVDGVCQISVSLFQIIGSLFSFYIPLVIMLVTYALTVRLLSQKESELLASGYEAPITPLSHSVRLKRLLCKTTSTLSSTTATSIADTELSETAPSEDVEESETSINSPSRRAPYLRYASHYRKHGRNYAIREKSPNIEAGAMSVKRGSYDRHLRPPVATSTAPELSVFPKYDKEDTSVSNAYQETPKKKNKSLSSNGTRKPSQGVDKASHDRNKVVEIRIIESTPVENPVQEDPDSEEGLNGASVTVPCSCAPKFFLEGISRNSNSSEICGDCSSQYEGISSQGASENSETDQGSSTFRTFLSKIFFCHKDNIDAALDSPWHEEPKPSPCPSDSLLRPNTRLGYVQRQPVSSPVASISPSSSKTSRGGGHSNSAPNRTNWRTKSCTASMRFVSSKRHGRNIRMEQKATKVLGIVFFTFVILWAPFFIINILVGACPSCMRYISDDAINFVTWMGYVSSTVNPFFYTFFNKTFREAFYKILKCNLRTKRKYNF